MIASKLFPDELNKSLDKKVINVRYLGDDGIEDAEVLPEWQLTGHPGIR